MFRIGIGQAGRNQHTRSNSLICAHEIVGILHLWNEHIANVRLKDPFGWSVRVFRAMEKSLVELCMFIESDDRFRDIQVFIATITFATERETEQVTKVIEKLGFERITFCDKPTLRQKLHDFGENILLALLLREFDPNGLDMKHFFRHRIAICISKKKLFEKYAEVT